jgi:hypothetical protein
MGPFDAYDARSIADVLADASACPTTPEEAGECNDVMLSQVVVTETCASGEPPQPEGGTIEDGVYVLESVAIYGQTGCVPGAVATAWSICGSQWAVAQRNLDEAGESIYRVDYAASVGATAISLTPTCEADVGGLTPMTRDFSATPAGLTFITTYPGSVGSYVVVGSYAKQ